MGFNKANGDPVPASEWNNFLASAGLYAASAAGSDSYAITVSPVPNDYDAGDTYFFKADVANTGPATLNVNSLGAKTIKKFGTQDLETGDIIAGQIVGVKYDGTYFQIASEARPTPFYQQQIPVGAVMGTAVIYGSNSSGSVFYTFDTQTAKLSRFERDTLTGAYSRTHQVTPTQPSSSWQIGNILQIGIYIYLILDTSGSNIEAFRFVEADLTSQTTMTVPAVASSGNVVAWTNGTDVYVVSGSSGTTSRKWTISGTTMSAAATYTVSDAMTTTAGMSSLWDGTNAWLFGIENTNEYKIRKLTAIDGTSYSETTKTFLPFNNSEGLIPLGLVIDATKFYLGQKSDQWNQTDNDWSVINLKPISKP